MDCTQLSFANVSAAVSVQTGGMAANTTECAATPATPLGKPRSWAMLRALDQAILALSRNMAAWASAGRL